MELNLELESWRNKKPQIQKIVEKVNVEVAPFDYEDLKHHVQDL